MPRATGYSCLQVTQNEHRFYMATIPVSDLFDCCFLAWRHEDAATGFQRRLNENRAQEIAAYLKRGDGSIPTNIVLSAQSDSGFRYSSKSKQLFFNRTSGGFLVLDGQHRLYGYQMCLEQYDLDHRVPVSIYSGLSREDEARIFIDINTKQIGVPAALLLDIKQVANTETAEEEIIRKLSDRLATDSKSPLIGKLSRDKAVVGKLSRPTCKRALIPVIRSTLFSSLDNEARYVLIRNFLRATSENLINPDWLFRAAFFEAIFDVFEETIKSSLERKGNAKEASLTEVLRPLGSVDFTNFATNRSLTSNSLKQALRQNISISNTLV
jgi:DGQHR domain-containing protein